MEGNEISVHQLRIYLFVKGSSAWLTSKEVAIGAKVADRTARQHLFRLVGLGIFDQAEVFPGHRYKFSDMASKRNYGYLLRLEQAKEVMSL